MANNLWDSFNTVVSNLQVIHPRIPFLSLPLLLGTNQSAVSAADALNDATWQAQKGRYWQRCARRDRMVCM